MKIPVKVILCYLASVLAIFLLVNIWGDSLMTSSMEKRLEKRYSSYASEIVDGFILPYYDSEYTQQEMVREMKSLAEVIDARIWLVNSKSVVVADTGDGSTYVIDEIDSEFLNDTVRRSVTLGGIFKEPMTAIIEPVLYDYTVRGYLCIFIPESRAAEESVPYMNVENIILLMAALVLAVVFTVLYFTSSYPSRKIVKAAKEYAEGNYGYQLDIRSHDEFRDLAEALKYMVGKIKSVDDYQKKFIGNVSHDFRSPLTSIKGYAEAIKDGTIPPELQNKYLDVILFESDRLTKLTTNLLDLNIMDDKGLILEITSFDINTVIKNVAAAFEGICTQKKIVLDLSFASWETYVDADLGRIQQVIYNLTDNAVKFSNQNSTVDIETEEKGSKVLVRVRDYGMGISKENIKKIWDRFYKGDSSRGKDKKGTGLGLSIVKEIITAHGENINVISTEGVGTEFTFTLPKSAV